MSKKKEKKTENISSSKIQKEKKSQSAKVTTAPSPETRVKQIRKNKQR